MISAWNEEEGARHAFAINLFAAAQGHFVVPWPVYTEVDLFLRGRRSNRAADLVGQTLLSGAIPLVVPTDAELAAALGLLRRYADNGLDLPDAIVMAMTAARRARAFTWDFRHFRAVVLEDGRPVPLLVEEHEMP